MASFLPQDIKKLYECKNREETRELLIKLLNYTSLDEEEDPRMAIMIDLLLESIDFASKQGFSWQQASTFLQMIIEIRENAFGLSLKAATDFLKNLFNEKRQIFGSNKMSSIITFVFSVIFNHFNLYKFVFEQQKIIDNTCYDLYIESPPNIQSLKEGIEKSKWDELQMLKKLENEHKKNAIQRQAMLDIDVKQIEQLVQNKLVQFENQENLTPNSLKNIVEETVKMFVASTQATIASSIEESQENLEYEFSKSSIQHKNDETTLKKKITKAKSSK